jgi:hypothetical protein
MKITSILIMAMLLKSSIAFSQNCDLPVQKGGKLIVSTKTYDAPIDMYDIKSFTKKSDDKRQAMIDNHNDAVEAGKAKPKSVYDAKYVVDELTSDPDYAYAKLVLDINGNRYLSHMICENDTLYLMRKEGKTENYQPGTGKFLGYQTMGTQVLPRNIKVGDRLMPYTDNIYSAPLETTIKTNKLESVSRTSWQITYRYSVHDVLEISESITETINYAISEVTGTKEFKLNGKTYTAYVIESETWTKTRAKNEFTSLDGEINAVEMAENMEKFYAKIQKKVDKATLANEGGYIVIPKTEWYVPELGVVNTVAKFYGFITSETKLIGLE